MVLRQRPQAVDSSSTPCAQQFCMVPLLSAERPCLLQLFPSLVFGPTHKPTNRMQSNVGIGGMISVTTCSPVTQQRWQS